MAKINFTKMLQQEIKPALGVTEVGAIALAAARAYAAVGGSLLHIEMVMNGEIKDSKTQTIILKADKYFQKQKEENK